MTETTISDTALNVITVLANETQNARAICEKLAKANEKIEKEYEYQGLLLKSALSELDLYHQKYGAIESENENA